MHRAGTLQRPPGPRNVPGVHVHEPAKSPRSSRADRADSRVCAACRTECAPVCVIAHRRPFVARSLYIGVRTRWQSSCLWSHCHDPTDLRADRRRRAGRARSDGALGDLAGLRPQTAANADEALASLRMHHYDLAVIDVMMPGHDGLWLANEVQREHPHTAVVDRDRLHRAARRRRPAAADRRPPDQAVSARAVRAGRRSRAAVAQAGARRGPLARGAVDRVARPRRSTSRRDRRDGAPGVSEADALTALAVERMPETAAHAERVARYAQSVARELDVDRRSAPTWRSRRAFTTSASWRCPRRF